MEKGNFVTWVEPKEAWPPFLIGALKKYKSKYGEGPFEIIGVIPRPEPVNIVFIDKNGKEATENSLWFKVVALEEAPSPSVH